MGEFDLIERIRARSLRAVAEPADVAGSEGDNATVHNHRGNSGVVLGIGDDAAVLAPPAGQQLVATADTLVRGVHYPLDTAPADIGWKALAVNLSDLAAMGATPAWSLLALTREAADPAWLDDFLDGWCALADATGVSLVGGDTTTGPESITVTALGLLPAGSALTRGGASVGDRIWVSGTTGDAAAALALLERSAESGAPSRPGATDDAVAGWAPGSDARRALLVRLQRPAPRVALGAALRGVAGACIDVSDGLLADLGHIAAASGVGAEIDLAALPASRALATLADAARWPLQLAGGDDYELCFTAPVACDHAVRVAAARAGTAVTAIGRIVAGSAVRALRGDRSELQIAHRGYQHYTL